jgi:hypothetical protein
MMATDKYIRYSLFLIVSYLSYMSPSNNSVKRVVRVQILRPRSRLCSKMDKAFIPVATGANTGIATYLTMSFPASATELIRLERSNRAGPCKGERGAGARSRLHSPLEQESIAVDCSRDARIHSPQLDITDKQNIQDLVTEIELPH